MANTFFKFKQFVVNQDNCAMKVTTDSCLFGAWCAAQIARSKEADKTALDIGAATGLLSLMIAQQNDITIDAVEIDPMAAEQAKENIAQSIWSDRISVYNKDILEWTKDRPYDFIVANPPFYERDLASPNVQKNIAHHSTQLPLDDLLRFIKAHLSIDGIVYLLLPYSRKDYLMGLMSQLQMQPTQTVIVSHSPNHTPFRLFLEATAYQCQPTTSTSELVIKLANGQYSSEFIKLLKDYYLYL